MEFDISKALRRIFIVAIFCLVPLWFLFPDQFKLLAGFNSNKNDTLEWSDSYISSHPSCELEPLRSKLANSANIHSWHWPKDCHELIAQTLFSAAQTEEELSHAAYHQILSGKGFRHISLFTVWRHDWKTALQKFDSELILKDAIEEAKGTAKLVYKKDGRTLNNISWAITTAQNDMELFAGYGNRRAYLVLPATLMLLLMGMFGVYRRFW